MADGGYGRGSFDWSSYLKIMGALTLLLVVFIIAGEWAGFLH